MTFAVGEWAADRSVVAALAFFLAVFGAAIVAFGVNVVRTVGLVAAV